MARSSRGGGGVPNGVPPVLLTLDDVARELQVSRRTVDRYVRAGDLHVRRLSPRLVRVEPTEVERFVLSRDDPERGEP
jgi:excisionase family DNA binding protein